MKIGFANPLRQTVLEVHTLDVWGNKRDGWEVNAAYRAGKIIINKPNEDVDQDDIIYALKKDGYLRKNAKNNKYDFDWDCTGGAFITYTGQSAPGYPVFNIQNVTEDHMY